MANFVVCGATGRTGSAATRELLNRGHRVTAIVRDPGRAARLKAAGVRLASGSLADPEVISAALRGGDALFALLPEDPLAADFHAPRTAITEALVTAVKESGVPHVVLLSAIAASLPSGNGPAKDLHQLENALAETGTVLTTLRACWMQENVGAVVKPARAAGIYPNFMFSADAAFPTIASRDIGAFVADVITDHPRSETIDLLGPAYSARQVAQTLGKVLGKPLRIVDIPAQAQVSMLMQAGVSQSFAEAVAELYACFGTGRVKPRGDRQLAGTTPLETTITELLASTR
ncbi:MAG TPA: NmrA family NAD(P)-binding protein [Gemmatimonadales bacterium]|nr:NmrA family NAD(P)-binding protein [Gemmatimonadales bacterium]